MAQVPIPYLLHRVQIKQQNIQTKADIQRRPRHAAVGRLEDDRRLSPSAAADESLGIARERNACHTRLRAKIGFYGHFTSGRLGSEVGTCAKARDVFVDDGPFTGRSRRGNDRSDHRRHNRHLGRSTHETWHLPVIAILRKTCNDSATSDAPLPLQAHQQRRDCIRDSPSCDLSR